jgi:hypothetical protein
VVLLNPVILSKVFCALEINAVSRKRRVRRDFFIGILVQTGI